MKIIKAVTALLALTLLIAGCDFSKNGGYYLHNHTVKVQKPDTITMMYQVTNTFDLPVPGLTADDFFIREEWDKLDPADINLSVKTKSDLEYTMKNVLVVDTSNSYSETEFEGVKTALKAFVDKMFDGQEIAIVQYGATASLVSDFKDSSKASELKASIDGLEMTNPDDVVSLVNTDQYPGDTKEKIAESNDLKEAMKLASSLYSEIYTTSSIVQGFILLVTDGGHLYDYHKELYIAKKNHNRPDIEFNFTLGSVSGDIKWQVNDIRGGRRMMVFDLHASILEHDLLYGIASEEFDYCAGTGILKSRLEYNAEWLEKYSNSFYFLTYNTQKRFDSSIDDNTYKITLKKKGNANFEWPYKIESSFSTKVLYDSEFDIVISGITGDKPGLDYSTDYLPVGVTEYKEEDSILLHPEGSRIMNIWTPGFESADYTVASGDVSLLTVSSLSDDSSRVKLTASAVDAASEFNEVVNLTITDNTNKDKDGNPLTRVIAVNITEDLIAGDFIEVQGGTFTMGSIAADADDDECAYAYDKVDGNEVTVDITITKDFYMCSKEVSQKLWFEIMDGRPSAFIDDSTPEKMLETMNKPVESVTWSQAVDFCNKLSRVMGLEECYTGSGKYVKCDFTKNGYRLPTEAEWEYAAKGGHLAVAEGAVYPLTADADSDTLDEVAWYQENGDAETHECGFLADNALGLYDMAGNVWEWCWDWYKRDQYKVYVEGDADDRTDPTGSTTLLSDNWIDEDDDGEGKINVDSNEDKRVVRGGSFFYPAEKMRVSNRNSLEPTGKTQGIGFRLVRTK